MKKWLTWVVVEGGRKVLGGVSIGGVADDETGFAHRPIANQNTLHLPGRAVLGVVDHHGLPFGHQVRVMVHHSVRRHCKALDTVATTTTTTTTTTRRVATTTKAAEERSNLRTQNNCRLPVHLVDSGGRVDDHRLIFSPPWGWNIIVWQSSSLSRRVVRNRWSFHWRSVYNAPCAWCRKLEFSVSWISR